MTPVEELARHCMEAIAPDFASPAAVRVRTADVHRRIRARLTALDPRASWPDLTYFRVRPSWIRFSDFNSAPPRIVEFSSEHLATAPANER